MIECLHPIILKSQGFYVRCGKCILCRLRSRREWSLRLQLEAELYDDNCFVTLTYNEENVPEELFIRDFQLFMKRLRKSYKKKVRYFLAAEYGDTYARPHFHAIFYNFSYKDKEFIENSWDKGFVEVAPLTADRANYCCGYVQKKLNYKSKRTDLYKLYPNLTMEERLYTAMLSDDWIDIEKNGYSVERRPFASMSRRPGIAYDWYMKNREKLLDMTFISYGGQMYPIPQYFKRMMFDDFPQYKEKFIQLQQDLENQQIMEYMERYNVPLDMFEFTSDYYDRVSQKCLDIERKNDLYLQRKKQRRVRDL